MKKAVLSLSLFAMTVLLLGCPSVPQKSQNVTLITADPNTVVHSPSGARFPEKVAGFVRELTHTYDQKGLDVSAAYNLTSPTPVAVTVYVYPSPKITSIGSPDDVIKMAREAMTDREFEALKNQITAAHKGARLIESRSLSRSEGEIGRYAEFEFVETFSGHTQTLRSRLYIFTYLDGAWTVKYRITSPADSSAMAATDAFVKSYQWK